MYDVFLTKAQYPNINWSLVDESFRIHNEEYGINLYFVAALDQPPFTLKTKVLYSCAEHEKVRTIPVTTLNTLQTVKSPVCDECNPRAKKTGKKFKKTLEDYQKQLNKILDTDNYYYKPEREYINANSKVSVWCRKHNNKIKQGQLKIMHHYIKKGYYNLKHSCLQCKAEEIKNRHN